VAAAPEDRLQALAFDELVGDVVGALDLADAEDLENVRILELRGELRLVHEDLGRLGGRRQRGAQLQELNDLLEARGPELGRSVVGAEVRGVERFEQNELTELLLTSR